MTFDLRELAVRKVRLSDTYDTAQIKRALINGIRELEAVWELNPLPTEQRFRRLRRGEWQVVFSRKKSRAKVSISVKLTGAAEELVTRGVGASTALKLVQASSPEGIETAVELFDWYANASHPRGPGFLVDAIRNPDKYQFPSGFESSIQKGKRIRASESRNRAVRELQDREQAKASREVELRWRAFMAAWEPLPESEQHAFEQSALASASATKRDGYHRLRPLGGPVFEHYRRIVLLDHFDRRRPAR